MLRYDIIICDKRIILKTKLYDISAQDAGLYEKQFLLSAERGDLESVRKLLEIYKSTRAFNINCLDPLRSRDNFIYLFTKWKK
uniref:Uncharacterized protein n=1 Tax=Wuchereria bancrofti TaxID=6293 RepID=A0A1I8EMX3_WUCBA